MGIEGVFRIEMDPTYTCYIFTVSSTEGTRFHFGKIKWYEDVKEILSTLVDTEILDL